MPKYAFKKPSCKINIHTHTPFYSANALKYCERGISVQSDKTKHIKRICCLISAITVIASIIFPIGAVSAFLFLFTAGEILLTAAAGTRSIEHLLFKHSVLKIE